MIPSALWAHITIEEINSLTEDELDMLLYICNVLYPIKLPECKEENCVTLNLIRYTQKPSIISRINDAHSSINEEGKLIYNNLRQKLNLPIHQFPESLIKEQINNGPTTGSNVQ